MNHAASRFTSPRVGNSFAQAAIFLATLSGLPTAIRAQTLDFSAVEAMAQQELVETKTPGCAVALVKGDQVVFMKGFGVTSVETGELVKSETLFRPGSSTKMLTAAALVGLAVEGKLDLNEPIGKLVPGLPPRVSQVTAHQLMCHKAGLLDETAPTEGSHDESALGAGIKSWTDARMFTEPGQINSYSNPGYWMAGYLVEVVSGQPYADAMDARLFRPLGMTRTTFRPLMAMTYPLSQGHETGLDKQPVVVRPMIDTVAQWPAGSVYTNVQDMSHFLIAFLNGGKFEGKQVIDPRVIELMTTSHAPYPDTKDSYGYGLQLSDTRGIHMWEHGGSRLGFGSTIRMAPDYRVGVVILTNKRQHDVADGDEGARGPAAAGAEEGTGRQGDVGDDGGGHRAAHRDVPQRRRSIRDHGQRRAVVS